VSPDGRFVAFTSFSRNLVAGDTNESWDVFIRDLQSSPPPCQENGRKRRRARS
jgi:hypothetical protein